MNSAFRLLAAATLALPLCAQTPENPPPWWRAANNQTVSLHWAFDPGPGPVFPAPTQLVAPSWFQLAVTVGVPSANLQRLPQLGGRIGVLGLPAAGTATLELTVDNDYQVDWIKIFEFQFDAYTPNAGDDINVELEPNPNYKRAIISEDVSALGGGWFRHTVKAQLMPQPDDEGINWTFTSTGGVGIDDLFVSSKCVKPGPDTDGDALGTVDDNRDVSSLTGGVDSRGIAVIEGPGPLFQRSIWVAERNPSLGQTHRLLRIAPGPTVTAFPLPGSGVTTVPEGPGDLAVETRTNAAGAVVQQIVWTVLDQRPLSPPVLLIGFDTVTGTQSTLALPTFPGLGVVPQNQTLGLAFDPSGAVGSGTFWISSTDAGGVGAMREFSSTTGALLDTRPLPPGVTGLGYDDTLGNFYCFSSSPLAPTLPIRAHGFELSGFDFQPTGVRFCGDLTVPTGTSGRGGIANGLEVWRSRAPGRSQLNLQCLVNTPNNPLSQRQSYRLAGPYSFGTSLLGRCGMANPGPFNGIPFLGAVFEPTLSGVPNALFASLILGFSNTTSSVGPLPLDLQPIGWPESVLSVAPTVFGPLSVPSGPGRFSLPIQLPATTTLGYTPVFVQWLVLDTSVPGLFATTQAGKTVLYP